ncbi:MAG: sulfatase [Verrucomicrobiota bacterium]
MTRLLIITIALLGGLARAKPPNVLLILADDLSWFDLGCYGNKDVRTPNIDKLASDGMKFSNAFTATAMCAPTRQQLYTGLFPVRNGAMANHSEVKPGTKSMVHHLGSLGYDVHLYGKTHFGPTDSFPFEITKKLIVPKGPNPFCLVVATKMPHQPWPKNETYDPEKLTLPPYFIDNPETRLAMARYYTEVTQLDGVVGDLLSQLEANGQADNTVVIFTSEQGSAFFGGKWTCYDRGLKTALIVRWPGEIEPGSKSDALVQYVDVVPTLVELAGGDSTTVDTGRNGAPGGGNGFDGKSFLEILRGQREEHHPYVYGVHTMQGAWVGGPFPIRSIRDDRYKFIWNLMPERPFANFLMVEDKLNCWRSWVRDAAADPAAAEIVERWVKRPEFEFYDTENDPFELVNLADDPSHLDRIEGMKTTLEAWMKQQGDRGIETELSNQAYEGKWNGRPIIR